jgi:hypothetical protein
VRGTDRNAGFPRLRIVRRDDGGSGSGGGGRVLPRCFARESVDEIELVQDLNLSMKKHSKL